VDISAWSCPHVTLAAMAARFVGRPVKLVLTRRQMYTGTGYRPETWQRVELGASRDGRLNAITHHGMAETSAYEQYVERLLEPTGFLHSCPNMATRYRLVPLDVHTPVYMRGPGVARGIFALGMPPDRVRFALGDSTFPYAAPHGGSMTMASVGSAVHTVCLAVRAQALELAAADERSPLRGVRADEIAAVDGRLFLRGDPSRGERYQEILARHGRDVLEWTEMTQPGDDRNRYSMHAFGARFAEVAVDCDFWLVRVRRLVGAYGAGRIVNPRMARSQVISGTVGGIGMALMEHTITDRHSGLIVNAELANYLAPVNADIADLEASFVEEHEPYVNPLGVKGVGELALVGVAPSIANAVFHATGTRVRDLPITPEILL
jgi:CO/xanthine dehydrogenase Mo-binding subunit